VEYQDLHPLCQDHPAECPDLPVVYQDRLVAVFQDHRAEDRGLRVLQVLQVPPEEAEEDNMSFKLGLPGIYCNFKKNINFAETL
jgi:hypothetical protein